MRRLLASLCALLLAACPTLAPAQTTGILGAGVFRPAGAYSGPGDQVASATAWWGLRAYKLSYATGSNNGVKVRRASDSATQNIVILTNGALDIASANSFAGTDATCTGTIATTTVSCTSASSTPHIGSTISGAGVAQPCYVTAVGSFVSGTGTLTVSNGALAGASPCGTISVGETLTMQYGLYVNELYDQTGNANHLIQATTADQPQLLPTCFNGLPCMNFLGSPFQLSDASWVTLNNPLTVSTVYLSGSASPIYAVLGTNGSSTDLFGAHSGSGGNIALVNCCSSQLGATANDVVVHAAQGVFSGASSAINVDGTNTTGSIGTTALQAALSGTLSMGSFTGGDYLTGEVFETGVWPSALSTGNRTLLCHNQHVYWETATSC